MTLRVLTGITTSGTPHLGNYVGAIRPALAAAHASGTESFYFLADYHALVKVTDPLRVQRSTLEIAATWLACGLDPDSVWFYRQSDVPEIPELAWLLTCVAGKGLLNRAHAYKAAVDRNRDDGNDDDAGINAGLFMYPVLMAADILLFSAAQVPVGRDQVQHIEMARDFAMRFNHLYGEHFALPQARVDAQVATLPGLDGRKMSKSYDNTIALFTPRAALKKSIFAMVTDSSAPGAAKDADASTVFQLYQAFGTVEETAAMRAAFADGIAWGDAKQALFERIDAEVAPLRERYEALMADPAHIEGLLRDGAARLRTMHAIPAMARLRDAVGLRALDAGAGGAKGGGTRGGGTRGDPANGDASMVGARADPSVFKQYRDTDGRFYFKLVAGDRVLVQSAAYDSPRDAGVAMGQLREGTVAATAGGAALGVDVTPAEVDAALAALRRDAADRIAEKARAS